MRFSSSMRLGALFGITLFCLCFAAGAAVGSESVGKTAKDITREALLPNRSKAGRPLPLAASWNSGQKPGGFGPDYQMAMIERGYHLLPWFYLPQPGWYFEYKYYETAIKEAARLRIPISFESTQWESLLNWQQYRHLPSDINPNVWTTIGRDIPELSPFGPVGLWRKIGSQWTSTPLVKKLQQWYPDPPLVLFISNNEQPKPGWREAEESNRFLARYGHGRGDEFKRRVIADAWIERYRSLESGMSKGLVADAWKNKARFIGFNAFGSPDFGMTQDWIRESLCIPGRLEPWPLAWDGASAQFYVMDTRSPITDYTVFSPQIEAMSYVFMLSEAYRMNPDFWFELSAWDGHETVQPSFDKRLFYASQGKDFSPARYAGMVKFGMWLLRPRLVRDYRCWDDTVSNSGAYFMAVADSVEIVYRDRTLRKFWRFGRLVANTARQNPYQAGIPKEYRKTRRWFLLDTNLDPPRPWTMSTRLPVFALALSLGERPQREWLIYAHSPLEERKKVEISIPEYGWINVDVSPSGNFYLVVEKSGEVRPLR